MGKLKPYLVGIACGLAAIAIVNRVPAIKKLVGG